MMTDVGSTLRAALSSGGGAEASLRVLRLIPTRVAGAVVDWDDGAGEYWASVGAGHRVVAFVFMKAPLAIVLSDSDDALISDLERSGCYAIRVESMGAAELCSDRATVVQLAGRPISEHFRHEHFSADDLVWATI